MIWKLALVISIAANIVAVLAINGAITDEKHLYEEMDAKDRRIFELESRPEAITALTPEQFATFMELARRESGGAALPRWK